MVVEEDIQVNYSKT